MHIRRGGTGSKSSDGDIRKTITKAPKHTVFFPEIMAPFLDHLRLRGISRGLKLNCNELICNEPNKK